MFIASWARSQCHRVAQFPEYAVCGTRDAIFRTPEASIVGGAACDYFRNIPTLPSDATLRCTHPSSRAPRFALVVHLQLSLRFAHQ